MSLQHLPKSAAPEDVGTVMAKDGVAVIDHLVEPSLLDRAREELATYMENTAFGPDDFAGRRTKRTGGLIARSTTCRDFIMDPLILGAVGQVLSRGTTFQLHLTQVISIGPGEPAQTIHRDQWAFDFFPFPKGYEVSCNTLWAMTDFTEENGATRVIPGSHLFDDRLEFGTADTIPAEMEKGSVLLYSGSLYHGAGANRSSATRLGVNLTYSASWLRQEENQYLSVPLEVARTLPVELLRVMGYARGAYALGYVDDMRDPIEVVRPDAQATGLGDLEAALARVRANG
jgi:ectoine hydroxylase-related dioxygenase (phytanoyl-CoA dioxygenase family)